MRTYQIRVDPAVTVGLRLQTGELALVWTTTPWTLPSNLLIMVHPDIDYVVVESDVTGITERFVLAEARLPAYAGYWAKSPHRPAAQGRGTARPDLHASVHLLPGPPGRSSVVEADFVTTTEGTGWCTTPAHSARRTSSSPMLSGSCR